MAEEEIKETAAAAAEAPAATEEVKVKKKLRKLLPLPKLRSLLLQKKRSRRARSVLTSRASPACSLPSTIQSFLSPTLAATWSLGVLRVTPVSRAPARARRLQPSSPLKPLPTRHSISACARWTFALRVLVAAVNLPSALSRMRASKFSLFET